MRRIEIMMKKVQRLTMVVLGLAAGAKRRKIKPKIQYRSRSLHTWIREENFDSASAGF
jgi:hypothetical protein